MLSIFAAADEAGSAPALDVDGRTLTFAEVAALTRGWLRPRRSCGEGGTAFPLVGAATLEALIALYGLLEERRAALLVHPRLTESERANLESVSRASRAPDTDAAAIVFTSGTTGLPRGAVLTRRALLASAAASAANLGWNDDDRWLLCMPPARVGGLSIVTRCLAARRCVSLMPKFDARILPGWIEDRRVTLVSLVPTMLARVLDAHPRWHAPAHLRAILLGGAAVSPSLLRRAAEREIPVVPSYGLTETCAQVVAVPYAARYDPADCGSGVPLPGVDLRIIDGRILVRGPMLMAGFWNEPPLAPNTWFDTGDLGEIADRGYLHVHARRTDLIVTGGENVYPAEVERVLETLPGVVAAGVFGIASEEWGQQVAAVLVVSAPAPSDAELIDHLANTLAPHKRPRYVCRAAELPQTTSNKLDRAALAAFAPGLRPLGRRRDPG